MKLEYLADGSPDCPLIRLYEFLPSEAAELKNVFVSLADGRIPQLQLHELPFVESVAGCKLRLKVTQRDIGILQTGQSEFDCSLSTDAWLEMTERVATLTKSSVGECYQWLNEDGDVSLLLSLTGRW